MKELTSKFLKQLKTNHRRMCEKYSIKHNLVSQSQTNTRYTKEINASITKNKNILTK